MFNTMTMNGHEYNIQNMYPFIISIHIKQNCSVTMHTLYFKKLHPL